MLPLVLSPKVTRFGDSIFCGIKYKGGALFGKIC